MHEDQKIYALHSHAILHEVVINMEAYLHLSVAVSMNASAARASNGR